MTRTLIAEAGHPVFIVEYQIFQSRLRHFLGKYVLLHWERSYVLLVRIGPTGSLKNIIQDICSGTALHGSGVSVRIPSQAVPRLLPRPTRVLLCLSANHRSSWGTSFYDIPSLDIEMMTILFFGGAYLTVGRNCFGISLSCFMKVFFFQYSA